MKVESAYAIEILNSRGNSTVEVDLTLDDGTAARSMIPVGTSTGKKRQLNRHKA